MVETVICPGGTAVLRKIDLLVSIVLGVFYAHTQGVNLSWRSIVQRILPQTAAAEAQALSERRLETRVPSQISVKLRWEDGDFIQETAGVAEDVSEKRLLDPDS